MSGWAVLAHFYRENFLLSVVCKISCIQAVLVICKECQGFGGSKSGGMDAEGYSV